MHLLLRHLETISLLEMTYEYLFLLLLLQTLVIDKSRTRWTKIPVIGLSSSIWGEFQMNVFVRTKSWMSQKTAFECPFLSTVSWRSLLLERIKSLCYIKGNKAIALFTKDSVVNLYCVSSKERTFANEKQWQKPYFRTKIKQVPQHKQFHILWPS